MKAKQWQGKIFYGWFIVAAGCVLMASVMGIVFNCSSLFIKPICADLGLTRQQVGGMITLISTASMFTALAAGAIFSRFGLRRVMQAASVALCGFYYCLSKANALWLLYLLSALCGVCFNLLTTIPFSQMLSNWFHEKRGLAVGITFAGSGLGGMVFNMLGGQWIQLYGWRTCYQLFALVLAVLVLPCTFFIIRVRPSDMGLMPLGESALTFAAHKREWGYTLSQTLRLPLFWLYTGCAIASSFGSITLNQCMTPHLSDIGYSYTFAANIFAVSMGLLAVGKLVLGQLYDRLGQRKATSFAICCIFCGTIGMLFSRYLPGVIVASLGMGFGNALGTVGYPLITPQVFGRRYQSAIYGVLAAVTSLAGILAPIINGTVYDRTGSYNLSFRCTLVSLLIALVGFQYVFTKAKEVRARGIAMAEEEEAAENNA